MNAFFCAPTIQVDSHAGTAVVTLGGEVDLRSRSALDAVVDRVVEQQAASAVVDLREAWFIDCSVLTMLAQLARVTRARGGGVRVVGARPAIRRMIDAGGLGSVLDLSPAA